MGVFIQQGLKQTNNKSIKLRENKFWHSDHKLPLNTEF